MFAVHRERGIVALTVLACAMIAATTNAQARRSGVEGTVRDSETREAIIEGTVQVVGGPRVFTDAEGRFSIDLAPGTYRLRVSYDLFQTMRVNRVVVRENERTRVNIRLRPDRESELATVVVRARADRATEATQITMRRESANAQDAISAQEMARSPDSNAGEAARRVVGTTVGNGSYLFVRGLGGRYTSALLNGAPLPSTDPDTPGVQLDLFPASVLSSLTILKTFTPDVPGDSSGGTLSLATREYPDDFKLQIGVSLGANSETTFANVLRGPTSRCDWLGFDCGLRALPRSVPRGYPLAPGGELTREQVNEASQGFRPSWGLHRELGLPNMRISANVGDTIDIAGRPFGYLLAGGYSNSTQRLFERVRRARLAGDEPNLQLVSYPDPAFERESVTNQVQWSALGNARYEVAPAHSVSLVSLLVANAEDYTGLQTGNDLDSDANIETRRLRYVTRNLAFMQVVGEHGGLFMNGLGRFRWQISGSLGSRDEPDTRDITYQRNLDLTEGPFVWRPTSGSGERLSLGLGYQEIGGSADLTIPIDDVTIKVGYLGRGGSRVFGMRRFTFSIAPTADPLVSALPPEDLFHPDNIGPSVWQTERTRGNDGYNASQMVHGAYGMVDVRATSWLRLVGGLRVEGFRQTVASDSPFGGTPNTPENTVWRTDVDPLPALSSVFTISDQMAVRLAYGTTVARPQVRELAPYLYPDFIRNRNIIGNPRLGRTRVQSFDARWEFFPSEREVLSATLFAKLFESPIEATIVDQNNTFSYSNVDAAENFGAELEARLSLGHLAESLRDISVGTNLTLLHSRVRLSEQQQGLATNAVRPLAGQSPFVINVSLGFAPTGTGLAFNLYYNVAGPKISDVGILRLPDIYSQPVHSLDFTASWEIDPKITLRLALENILLSGTVLDQGGIVIQSFNPGMSGSLSIGYTP